MRDGSLLRLHARFELERDGAMMPLVPRAEAHGHVLGAVGIAGDGGRALVFIGDAVALNEEAVGLPAERSLNYLLDVWPSLLQAALRCPSASVRWVFQDASKQVYVGRMQIGGAPIWAAVESTCAVRCEDVLRTVDPQLAPALLKVLSEALDRPSNSGLWVPLGQRVDHLNLRRGGADWAA
jgi:hypothetical protein